MEMLKKFAKILVKPFSIGLFLTLLFVYTSFIYYAADVDSRENHDNSFVNLVHRLHLASNDWKMKARGFRKGSDQVVILAIDEKSLEQEGQWPWPRGKFKEIIARLVDGGAKVVGFDVIWSEEEQNNSVVALEKLRQEIGDGGKVDEAIDRHMRNARTDGVLGDAVENYGEQVILGTYFNTVPVPDFKYPRMGYQNLCMEQIHRNSKNFEAWDNLDPMFSIIDQSVIGFSDELPEAFAAILRDRFERIASNVRKERGEALTKTDEIETRALIHEAHWDYCMNNWLVGPEDRDWEAYKQAWASVLEEDDHLQGLDFEAGIGKFKTRYMNSRMQMIGSWVMNTNSIQSRALYSAYFNAKQDSDGTIRRSYLMVSSGQNFFPSLAFHSFLTARGLRAQVTLEKDGVNQGFKNIALVELMNEDGEVVETVPVNDQGYLAINYAGPGKMFPHLSAADVLSPRDTVVVREYLMDEKVGQWIEKDIEHKKSDFYKDKIFIVGATATGIFDLRVTPFEENFPGVETHANVVDNLLRRDFLRTPDNEDFYMLGVLLAMGLLFSFLVSRFGAAQGAVIVSAMLAFIFLFDWFYFFKQGWVVSTVFPVGLIFMIYAVLTIIKYFTEERNKKQLKGTFGKYVSPAIVEEILADPSNIELGGRKQNVTVFFSDVRGFTTISETLSPTDLGDLLNEYLTPMTEIIFENKGTLDKYIGDAIMAFFGAPMDDPDHPKRACLAALENIRELFKLQKVLEERGLPHIDVGIGLNTGDVSVGNMGSNIVRNYTIMGDSVNLGARLEGITKQYGVRIIISEYTEKHVRDDFLLREVDCVKVKGKNEPVHIFELMEENGRDETKEELAKRFNAGYKLYHEKKFTEAIEKFESALEVVEDDKCSQLYIDRSNDYIANPPPEDWDGVFTMTTK